VSGIPMASESSAFLLLTLLFFVVILIQVLIFKKFKWF
jgi:Mg2+ and Co2+ transporter CorA